ncbi:MAG TPA: ATP-binding protein [Geobacteraceae bacterium]
MVNDQAYEPDITYVVGEEKRLTDILTAPEVVPLLKGMVRAGATEVALLDVSGATLWRETDPTAVGSLAGSIPFYLEGEPVGRLVIKGETGREEHLRALAGLLLDALNTIIANNMKRMLTTEVHTAVVNQSYQELVETNRRLSESEARYRELAEKLEIKVRERTDELKQAHARLLQQEKMVSVGQLAAGMAHEINNPLGFITSNLHAFRKYAARLLEMVEFYRTMKDGGASAAMTAAARRKWESLKLDLVSADIDVLIGQSLEGAERVGRIVADLKGFSHIDELAEGAVDLNAEIDRTISVLCHEIPADAEITKNYQPLPRLVCNPALICQAFFSIIQNALQARKSGLRLAINTFCDGSGIRISFADNGPGIPLEIRDRLFEPFFTTREVGSGTGMGLTIAYDVVTRYGGTIEADSPAEGGAMFTIALPAQRTKHV